MGGTIYGHYLLTHNINPESGGHPTEYQQVYDNALRTGMSKGARKPHLPRKINDANRLSENQVKEIAKRNPIMPKDRHDINGINERAKTAAIQGKKTEKEGQVEWKTVGKEAHIKIVKPDLRKEKYMQRGGDQSTPNISAEQLHQASNQSKKSLKSVSQNQDLLENLHHQSQEISVAPSEREVIVGGESLVHESPEASPEKQEEKQEQQ